MSLQFLNQAKSSLTRFLPSYVPVNKNNKKLLYCVSGKEFFSQSAALTETAVPETSNLNKSDVTDVQEIKQSAPLTDTFGRYHTYLRISLTERCNLRCKYCMPSEGVQLSQKSQLLTNEEVFYLSKIFVEQGVRKIRLTGGEPTVRKDIVDIIAKIRALPDLESVSITTNGLMLTRLLVPMQRAGLGSLNISLDTLKVAKYEQITRRKGYERVIAGIDLAIQLGYRPKINCVMMKNFNDDEICDFVEFTKDRNVDVRFIEYMPFTGNKWETDKMVSFRDMLNAIKKTWPNFEALSNGPNDTSKAYAVPGFKGQVGFITSMTEHFCGSCNRLRITADGNLKVCLFGNTEVSLRDAIRNQTREDDLIALISAAVKRKKKQHAAPPKSSVTTISNSYLMSTIANLKTPSLTQNSMRWNSTNSSATSQNSSDSETLTHVDSRGQAKMVDVSVKGVTNRYASAQAIVYVGPKIAKLIKENSVAKGDVLTISRLAGIIGAKRTSEIIPLCHNINLSSVKVDAELVPKFNQVLITSKVTCEAKTGVEMEALTAVSTSALCIYDMCKAISHDIIIKDIMLLEKSGGKKYFNRNPGLNEEFQLKYKTDPIDEKEPFYPIHI